VTASGISGPKAEPDSEDANELKKTLWEGESYEEWAETYNTYVPLPNHLFPAPLNPSITGATRTLPV